MADERLVQVTGESAKSRYERQALTRQPYLDRAREAARVTIPALMPPDGYDGSTMLPSPYQSVGARGTNHLAGKLILALFPPGSPFFKLTVSDFELENLIAEAGGTDARAEVDEAFSKVERAVTKELDQSGCRAVFYEALRHLIVSGNVLLQEIGGGQYRLHPLDKYTVLRQPNGELREIIVRQPLSRKGLPEALEAIVAMEEIRDGQPDDTATVDLYTHLVRDGNLWRVRQELLGHIVPDSHGSYADNKSPWHVLRFTRVDGEHYGRSHADDHLGDLLSLESLSESIVTGVAVAVKTVFLVNPGGTTSAEDVAHAENGDVKEGDARDVTVIQSEKAVDLQVAAAERKEIQQRLEQAFLLFSQRDAERVTAEEIRMVAQELEAALGGVYSVLAVEFQLPVVRRYLYIMQRARKLPALPEKVVNPTIVTGVAALGRGSDLQKLEVFVGGVAELLGPEGVGKYINVSSYLKRKAAALGLSVDGMVRSEQEVAEMEQAQAQDRMREQLAPEVVRATAAQQGEPTAQETQ